MGFLIFMIGFLFVLLVAAGGAELEGATSLWGIPLYIACVVGTFYLNSNDAIRELQFHDIPAFKRSIVWEIGAAILVMPAMVLSFARGTKTTENLLALAAYAFAPLVTLIVVLYVAFLCARLEDKLGLPRGLPRAETFSELLEQIRDVRQQVRAHREWAIERPPRGRRYYAMTAFWTLLAIMFFVAAGR